MEALLQEAEERRYRAYVTDALMVLTENSAKYAQGQYLTRRWAEGLLPQDDKSGDEIAAEFIRRAGLRFKG